MGMCKENPRSMEHCWHVEFLDMDDPIWHVMIEICCWCGETKETKKLKQTQPHGPHAPHKDAR